MTLEPMFGKMIPSDGRKTMDCECEACTEDQTIPPIGYVSHEDWLYDMAWDACWQDFADV